MGRAMYGIRLCVALFVAVFAVLAFHGFWQVLDLDADHGDATERDVGFPTLASRRLAQAMHDIKGWVGLNMAASIPITTVETALELALYDVLNLSSIEGASVSSQGRVYDTTTTTTSPPLPTTTTMFTGYCRSQTRQEAKAARLAAAGCPNANPVGCQCSGHGRPSYDCPGANVTLWPSAGKRCVTARPDRDSTWAKHDWHYPADYWTYCPPIDGSRPGSPPATGLAHWPEPGSYHCTKVAGQAHAWKASSPGYNTQTDSQGWCTTPACFVNPCTCAMDDIAASSWFQGTEAPKLYYSYAQCGGQNTFLAASCAGNMDPGTCNGAAGCEWEYEVATIVAITTTTTTTMTMLTVTTATIPYACRAKTKEEAKADRLIAAGCPNATLSGCECSSHGRPIYDCPDSSTTLWDSAGKKCVTARPDKDSTGAKHDWHYPADYWTYCPPTNGSLPGSPPDVNGDGYVYWPEPGSYDCTKVAGQSHTWDANAAGYNGQWNTESWCTKPGCFVDPCTCDMDDVATTSLFQGTPGPTIYYSYAQCGAVDTFTAPICSGHSNQALCMGAVGCKWDTITITTGSQSTPGGSQSTPGGSQSTPDGSHNSSDGSQNSSDARRLFDENILTTTPDSTTTITATSSMHLNIIGARELKGNLIGGVSGAAGTTVTPTPASTPAPAPTTTTTYIETVRFLNVSFTVTVPEWASAMVQQLTMEIANDFSSFNATLWEYLVAQGVDPDLVSYYGIHAMGANAAVPTPPTTIPREILPTSIWNEAVVGMGAAVMSAILLFLTRRAHKRRKMTEWAHIAKAAKDLTILSQVKRFDVFCNTVGPQSPPKAHHMKKPGSKKRFRKMYLQGILRAIEIVFVTGWRFECAFALLSVYMTFFIRGARWYTSAKTGERMVSDHTIDANLAGASKVVEVLLPLASFMVGLFVALRLKWLHHVLDTAHSCQRHIFDIALTVCNAMPHHNLREVNRAKWLLYRYCITFLLFAYAEASPRLKVIVHGEMMGSEALSKTALLTVEEEEELSKSDTPCAAVLIWISHLLVQIGRASDAERPCVQQLIKSLMSLRCVSQELVKEMDRSTPISFLQLLYLIVDVTVFLTPLAVMHIMGADHEGYSMYMLPMVTTVVVSIAFHGSIRLIDEAQDPLSANISDHSGTNIAMLETEHRLFSMLRIREPARGSQPLRRVEGELEPIWAGSGLGWLNAPGMQTFAAESSLLTAPQRFGAKAPRDPAFSVPGEGFDNDMVSVETESQIALSDVDPDDPDDPEERLRPPVFKRGSHSRTQDREHLAQQLAKHGVAFVEAAQLEASQAKQQLILAKEAYLDLQANSVPAEDAEQVVQLLAEWIAPPRPVRLSDVSLAKLAEMSRKQSVRVKKILSLGAGRLRHGALRGLDKPPGIAAAEQTSAKASADYKSLLQDLLERLDEENQVSMRLKSQLAEAGTLNINMGSMPVTIPSSEIVPMPAQEDSVRRRVTKERQSLSDQVLGNERRGLTKDGKLK